MAQVDRCFASIGARLSSAEATRPVSSRLVSSRLVSHAPRHCRPRSTSHGARVANTTMPPKFPWSKSNRALQSIDRLDSLSSGPIGSNTAPDEPGRAADHADRPPGPSQLAPPLGPVANAPSQHGEQYPQRTASKAHRLSAAIALGQPPLQDLQAQQPASLSSPAPGGDTPHYTPPAAHPSELRKPSLTSRIAAGVRGHKKDESARNAYKTGTGTGVARSQSLRTGDFRAHEQLWTSPPLQLPTSHEHEVDPLEPFPQPSNDSNNTPQVPRKDALYQPQHQQLQYTLNPLQEHYTRPSLNRVNTVGSAHNQDGINRFSPDQHTSQVPLQPQQRQPYQSYQPALPRSPSQNAPEYQAFNPQATSSSLPQDAQQLQGRDGHGGKDQDPAEHQQDLYSYPHQHQHQNQHQVPLEQAQQTLHYHQQPHSQPQTAGTPSQQQTETSRTLAARQTAHIDAQQPQQLSPPSSNQQVAPASPLQAQSYHNHETPTRHSRSFEGQTQDITPPEQSQDNMASQGQSNTRNTLRKANDGSQSCAPARESSLPQPPSTQASQGQPYRGEKQGQQGQGEMGRATPPPRTSVIDVTEEEIEKMIKDHDVLREKYQKVKRYFFEQQSQVHQLQNTLANQRLSMSRTSWDDSEYSTRFNRLDGLIAQLSFTIRKEWRMIPQWLQVVVNKTAIETGKQEMTAVGRAFMSQWLVENIFDKYFHPDLEPGFSTQLQSIVTNIRKFSPPCHTIEDEEALAAKIINWRLATLEGLADTLKGPQTEMYRQQLTNTLNEKLIASLQMHLNDPAPPDLVGGVPMIIELAISITQHLPLESREVHIEYFPPRHAILPESMKIETTIPALTAPVMELDETDQASLRSVASKVEDGAPIADQDQAAQPKEDKKRSMFGFGASKKPTAAPTTYGKREVSLGQGESQQNLGQNVQGNPSGAKEETPAARVRFAAGLAVQIRGKSILVKAPVYSM